MAERFWWVNHSHTSRWEIPGDYLWFAKASRSGRARGESYQNILRLLPGDVVVSFADAAIGAVGVVLGTAREAPRPPEFEALAQHAAAGTGWLTPVRFMAVASPLRIAAHAAELGPVLPGKHAPIRANGACNQHIVLSAVPGPMVASLRRLLGGEVERIVETISEAVGRSLAEDAVEAAIRQRADIGPVQKAHLLKARHGQGLYREKLEAVERACRITGLFDRRHLRATHIKPWSECDDRERLDGFNGLLMSAHVAHLFSRGYISFADDGELLVSQELNPAVLESWHVALPRNAGTFVPEQCRFLDHHRREVFGQHGGGRRQSAPVAEGEPAAGTLDPVVLSPA